MQLTRAAAHTARHSSVALSNARAPVRAQASAVMQVSHSLLARLHSFHTLSRHASLATKAISRSAAFPSLALSLSSAAASVTALSSSPSASLCQHSIRTIKGVPRKKLKSHSGSKKRFRFTRTGLIMRWRGGKHHKNIKKSASRLRRLSKPTRVYYGHLKSVRRSLPYGMRHSR